MKSISSAFASFRAYWPHTYAAHWLSCLGRFVIRLFA